MPGGKLTATKAITNLALSLDKTYVLCMFHNSFDPEMRVEIDSPEYKTVELLAFGHWLRTGRRLPLEVFVRSTEQKFNPYHDPRDGRFTFAPGRGSLAPRTRCITFIDCARTERAADSGGLPA